MRLLPRHLIEHRAARALSDDSSIQRENQGVWSVMVGARREFVASSVRRLRRIMRPLNLGLIGLAVAVAIWGFAYKLSLYQPHPSHSAQANVAKLWLGPKGTFLTAKSRPKSHLQPKGTLDAALTPQVITPHVTRNGTWTVSNSVVANRQFFADCSPRSPPAEVS
jgi:hypothetical protein